MVMAICASAGQNPAKEQSGIEGIITISPVQPGPIRVGAAGSKPLANTTFIVENTNGAVTSFTTDDQGHFQVLLPSGHYKASLEGKRSGVGRFGPFEVDVSPGKMTKVKWECDSGLR
jgi:hypothetical protein